MSYAPPVTVESQPRVALPYGLFSVLTPRPEGDGRWQNGIEWEALTCEPANGIGDPSCDPETAPTTGLPKTFEGGGPIGEASPFTIYGSYSCTPVGHTEDYAQERATEHLLAREEARVEQALWTGDLDNGGFATDATAVGGAGLSLTRAVAALEDWLSVNYGSLGVIHMPRGAALIAVKEGAVEVKGNRLLTGIGTPVVAGAGYPAGDETGLTIHATPALLGYRSEVFPGTSGSGAGFDRSNNDLFAVAERTYVIGYDPCGSASAAVTY